jgi:hypothetical protein
MPSTGNDPSAAAGFSFPDADGGGGGDSEDGDFADAHHLLDPTDLSLPNPTTSSVTSLPHAVPAGGSGPVTSGNGGDRRPLFQRL